jgi:hypothetical protein
MYSGDAERGDVTKVDQQRIGQLIHDHLDDQQPQIERRRAEDLTSHVDPQSCITGLVDCRAKRHRGLLSLDKCAAGTRPTIDRPSVAPSSTRPYRTDGPKAHPPTRRRE